MNKAIGLSRTHKRINFVEKFKKKYKTAVDKKRREKLFEEEDMMKVYLMRERILAERVSTEQLYPN